MSFLKKLIAVLSSHAHIASEIIADTRKREELDTRLGDLTVATINGEEQWFLQLVKKNPDCALEVIKECDLVDKNNE